jgi:hypothetical protein
MKSIRPKLGIPITILISALATQAHAQFTFSTNGGAITITKYTGPGGAVTIPSTTNGFPVTTIGASAFWQCFSLLKVTMPDTVTNVGSSAFNHCIGLTNVTLSQSLRTIAGNAFSYCSALRGISIPDSVTYIGSSAFDSCENLTSVTISSNVTNILQGAFVSCLKLTVWMESCSTRAWERLCNVPAARLEAIRFPPASAESYLQRFGIARFLTTSRFPAASPISPSKLSEAAPV